MRERVKMFTHVSGEGSMLIEPELQEHINEWLSREKGELVSITQSESTRPGAAQHITVCVWYRPDSPIE